MVVTNDQNLADRCRKLEAQAYEKEGDFASRVRVQLSDFKFTGCDWCCTNAENRLFHWFS